MRLQRCMVHRRRRSLTCLASCALRLDRVSCLAPPVRRLNRPPSCGRGKSRLVRKAKQSNADKVTAADIIAFIEQVCFVPEGRFVGKKLELFEWQKAEICRIYDNPHGTRRAILSMGRKNAKTTLAACLLLAHLCGPPARSKPNSQLYSAAQSRDQAAIIFSLAAKVRMNPELLQAVTIQETAKSLICPELGTRYRALSADATTVYGLSPALVIHDELGQVRGGVRSEEHTSELQSLRHLVCRLLLEKKKYKEHYWRQIKECYFTGDFDRRDKDGYFLIVDRMDDVITIEGHGH